MTGARRFRALAVAGLMVIATAGGAVSQNAAGTLSGTVTDPQGNIFPIAFVTAIAGDPSASVNGSTNERGQFRLQVPAGVYALSVNVPGMKPFRRAGVSVRAGEIVRADVRLEDGPALRTLGEDPSAIVANYFNRPEPPEGPVPRLANGKPDLSGVWLGGPADLSSLTSMPWAAQLAGERAAANLKDFPGSYCLPTSPVPLMGGSFFKLVHHPATLVMLFENPTMVHQVIINGRAHPPGMGPTWLGHSIGTWDGDTLVIDSIGFRDRGWLDFDGHAHSDKLHVVQRLRRRDLGHLEIEFTLDDPGAFSKPWTAKKEAALSPDIELQEYVCNENNKDVVHLVGK